MTFISEDIPSSRSDGEEYVRLLCQERDELKELLGCKSFSPPSPSKCGHLHTHFPSMANTIVFKIAYHFSLRGERENITTEGPI
jgi:hypothetical protein